MSAAVKDRVVSTFQQTLALHQNGRIDEVVAGCNLILQMDPLFDPARKLLEKARNPASPIDVASLTPAVSSAGGGLGEARSAMASRDFERVVQITTEILTNDLMNDEARILSEEAREKMEASPFVEQFARKCEQHIASGNLSAARSDLEKARALDPAHPALARVQKLVADKESAGPKVAATSFVVDTPTAPAGGRSTAQASDFGFTFEEEKAAPAQPSFASFSFDSPSNTSNAEAPFAGGFSFNKPAAGSAPPAAEGGAAKKTNSGEFDFSTASIETSPDDQKKIDQYLSDGDGAFEGGGYQQAIDLWSRIFLIDVTNEAASDRIERAKLRRRELEQKVEGVLSAGIIAYERKDYATARTKLGEVLQVDPGNASANEYMERVDAVVAGKGDASIPPSAPFEPPVLDDESPDISSSSPGALQIPSSAPAPAARKSAPRAAPAPAPSSGRRLPMPAIVVVGLLLLGAAGWFAWSKFAPKPKTDTLTATTVITQATSLGEQGKYDQAIAMLQQIIPGDQKYDAALAMISDLQQKKSKAAAMIDGRPAGEYYDENLAAAIAAFGLRDFLAAKKSFENAMRVKPLPPEAKTSYDAASQQVAKLDTARALFGERKYADVITALEPLLQREPDNRSIQRMITDAHFNLGATALQQERLQDAVKEFEQVLARESGDELAKRSRDLAQRYDGQPRDLLYRIYVKYLPLRQPVG
ncbi:MAG: tetratricopeptide repeat protein [Thermoanaerobaculia bacterium]|nr:tetratricopeptide repeat protein [Thermoanaerobaculia bacterium]